MIDRADDHPETVTAITNAIVVLVLPLVVVGLLALFRTASNTSATVSASPASPVIGAIVGAAFVMMVASPFAMLAAWRTWVHARAWRRGTASAWRGVAEAGASGFLVPLLYLAPGIVTRPTEAPAYIAFYGGAGLIIGLTMGLILSITARVVLRRFPREEPANIVLPVQ